MGERLFAVLAKALAGERRVVLAHVIAARGATPRKPGSRMLIAADWTHGTVGGGAMEARVVEAARAVLRGERDAADVDIDLTGRPGAAGVCGGTMQVRLATWDASRAVAAGDIAQALARGQRVDVDGERIDPEPRLLIVGGGHCALALHDLARFLDYDVWVFDERAECFAHGEFAGATVRHGDYAALAEAFDTQRAVHAALLNRDFPSDVATLRALRGRDLAFLGMMGSRKRIAEVLAAVGEVPGLVAPIGLEIGAETPHEIAVSILAQLISVRNGGSPR